MKLGHFHLVFPISMIDILFLISLVTNVEKAFQLEF